MKYHKYIFLIQILLLSIFIVSCSSVPTRFINAENSLGTNGDTGMLFHAAVYYPKEINIKFDSYIIGVEKSYREKISLPSDIQINEKNSPVSASNLFNDSKLLFISHIVKNNNEPNSNKNCFIYNAYNQKKVTYKQFAPYCDGADNNEIEPINAFKNSWDALKELKNSILNRVKENTYSHIIVITMGWNTTQEEAIFNFNSILSNMKEQSKQKFNPLVIGVTWPSEWESSYIQPFLIKMVSFANKAKDADELGMSWLGVLIHQTIPSATNLPIIVIGHSFGARATSAATCIGPMIQNKDEYITPKNVNTLINLQGAFRTDRLFEKLDKFSKINITYPYGCPNVKTLVLTSSSYDDAVTSHFWGTPYAGTTESYEKYCLENTDPRIQCKTVDSTGEIKNFHGAKGIVFVKANELIRENAYNTSGGAHSDIYRAEHGKFINQFINFNK